MESCNGKAMKELWDIASGTMPEDNPGSLKQQEYADILAYFLQLNEFPGQRRRCSPGRRADGGDQDREKEVMRGLGAYGRLALACSWAFRLASYWRRGSRKEVGQGRRLYGGQADRGIHAISVEMRELSRADRFTDDLFYTSFAGKPLWEMFDVISDSMPEDDPAA